MSRIENHRTVNADPAKVFDFLAERTNATKIVPHLERVWDIKPAAAGVGQTWRWAFRLFGMPFEGTAEMIEFDRAGKRLRFTTTGKLKSTWTYAVAPAGNGGSDVTIAVEHDIPDTVLGKVADRVALGRLGESSTQQALENIAAQFADKKSS
jgi:hypothetical protein